jgi:hypothetical protein
MHTIKIHIVVSCFVETYCVIAGDTTKTHIPPSVPPLGTHKPTSTPPSHPTSVPSASNASEPRKPSRAKAKKGWSFVVKKKN